ncbi:MAG: hypothetical protein KJ792_02760 [Actinobacteria bacterium]|nr:hypothetical protein [Actinomycetota bacterium]MCG2800486.1 hypothetical protein [Cellulomonas sp.]
MSATLPSAWAPTPSLVRSLRRAGWGPLGGREWGGVRDVLDALAATLPDRSGEGLLTMPQLAERASLSVRWTARCMAVLEDLGVVTWSRGGVVDGRPVPSAVRIVKKVLVELIAQARPLRDAADAARRQATRARLAAAAHLRGPDRYRRRSAHAALSTSPPPSSRGGAFGPAPTPEGQTTMRPVIPVTCEHDGDAGLIKRPDGTLIPRCPMCRRARERDRTDRLVGPVLDYAARAAGDTTLWDD